MKFIDLFCGIGGFRVALESLGHECVFSSEIDKHAREAYYRNFNEHPYGDITKIKNKEIPEHDIICAGFPCQSYSISGNHGGLDDDRGQLIWQVLRIAKYHKPKLLLLENVKNILSIDSGKTIEIIKEKFEKAGYNFNYHLLNASDYGIPQSRQRVYFVLIRKDLDCVSSEPKKPRTVKYLKDILEEKGIEDLIIERDDLIMTESSVQTLPRPIKVGYINQGRQGERIYSPEGHAITLSAHGGGVGAKTGLYLHNDKVRRLSHREAKKVMTFPLKHKISDGMQGYKQLGNAVMPKMIKLVFQSIEGIG